MVQPSDSGGGDLSDYRSYDLCPMLKINVVWPEKKTGGATPTRFMLSLALRFLDGIRPPGPLAQDIHLDHPETQGNPCWTTLQGAPGAQARCRHGG